MRTTNTIEFLLNDEAMSISSVSPTLSVLAYLRDQQGLTGTKEGCAEGDCGACTVIVGERVADGVQLRSVNACIQFLPTLHGKALYTVEYLKTAEGGLHPVQQAMVDCHGSQCGFCTPGFVMSLWGYYLDKQASASAPDRSELCTALSGNLCRCTGYKPILEAGEKMFDLPSVQFDSVAARARLDAIDTSASLHIADKNGDFYAPKTLQQMVELRREFPQSTLLAGGTDVGLWVNKQFRELGTVIYSGNVNELKTIRQHPGHLHIGAAVSLSDAYAAINAHYPETSELWDRFASVPIRNAGTLGGNIANGSPIGDSAPWLIVVGSRVVLRDADGARIMPLENLYIDYMKQSRHADEVIEAIEIPLPLPGQRFRTWKVCKRYDSDISAVCAAFNLTLENDLITDACVAYGGMAATSKRAARCEAALTGQPWTERTARAAMQALDMDYTPLSDMRASAEYRQIVARNLLYRFYLETGDQAMPATATRAFAHREAAP